MSLENSLIRCETFIKENFPNADVSPGSVLNELLVKIAAQLNNEITTSDIDSLSSASSINEAINSTTDTYGDIINEIASNYNVVRDEGSKVRGLIKVTVSARRSYFIESDIIFVQPNLQFNYTTTQNWEAVYLDDGDILQSNQIQLFEASNGLYYFILPVEAVEVGSEAVGGDKNNTQVTNKTKFQLQISDSIPSFVEAEAYGNFSSGRNRETDKELITRFKDGLSNKGLLSKKSISSVLKTNFPTFKSISIIGPKDEELTRNKHNIFGLSVLGMADNYIRTSDSIETTVVKITGTKVSTGVWTLTIPKTVVPGFYRIISVLPSFDVSYDSTLISTQITTGGTLNIVSKNYSFDQSSDDINNEIITAQEARFTKYQNCTIVFNYDGSTTSKDFDVMLAYTPLILDIQDFINSDNERIVASDYLIKAAIPCIVSLKLRLQRKYPLQALPLDNIRRDIFDYINNIPFGEDLIVSNIIDICHNYDVKRVDLPVKVVGTIWLPTTSNDSAFTISSEDELVIPTLSEYGVSKKTVTFFASYFDDSGEYNISIEES